MSDTNKKKMNLRKYNLRVYILEWLKFDFDQILNSKSSSKARSLPKKVPASTFMQIYWFEEQSIKTRKYDSIKYFTVINITITNSGLIDGACR